MTCFSVMDESLSRLLVTPNRGTTPVAISDERTTRSEIVGRGIFLGTVSGASAMWIFLTFFGVGRGGGGELESGSGFNI